MKKWDIIRKFRVGNSLIGFAKTSDLSASLASLIKKEGMSESLIFFKNFQKLLKNRNKKYNFCQIFWANRSFYVSERANERFAQKNEWFAHSLIYHERPEGIAHGHIFDMSNLSDSLTVAHLSWSIWANRSRSLISSEQFERMSKWANSQPEKITCIGQCLYIKIK